MYLTAEKKQEFFSTYGKSAKDTGSTEGQIAMFSYKINHLTEHMYKNSDDGEISYDWNMSILQEDIEKF